MSTIQKNGGLRSLTGYNGIPVANEADLLAALNKTGLNYTVEMEPHKNQRNGSHTGFYDVYRADNGACLGSGLSDRFNPIQNAEAFAPIADLARGESGLCIGGAHAFDGGRTAALAVDFGVMSIGDASINDTVLKRISFTNSHDGSGSARIAVTPYRLRCKNGLVSAMAAAAITVRHTRTAQDRMLQAARILRGIAAQMTRTETTYNVLARSKVNKEAFARILEMLFPSEDKSTKAAKNAVEAKGAIAAYYQDADGGFIERDTGWNLFNAITRYTDHDSAVRVHGTGDRSEARAASMLTGAIAEKNAKALVSCVNVLGVKDEIDEILSRIESDPVNIAMAQVSEPGSIDDILNRMSI